MIALQTTNWIELLAWTSLNMQLLDISLIFLVAVMQYHINILAPFLPHSCYILEHFLSSQAALSVLLALSHGWPLTRDLTVPVSTKSVSSTEKKHYVYSICFNNTVELHKGWLLTNIFSLNLLQNPCDCCCTGCSCPFIQHAKIFCNWKLGYCTFFHN